MTQTKIIITSRSVFQAALPFASKDPTRYYINGVCFNNHLAVACDGHMLAVIKPKLWFSTCDDEIIVASETIKNALKVAGGRGKKHVFIVMRLSEENALLDVRESKFLDVGSCVTALEDCQNKSAANDILAHLDSFSSLLGTIPLIVQDGTFPDWQRLVVPPITKFLNGGDNQSDFKMENLARFQHLGSRGNIFVSSHEDIYAFVSQDQTQGFDAVGFSVPNRSSGCAVEYPIWFNDALPPGISQPTGSDVNS